MKKVNFTKVVASGNDFVLLDNFKKPSAGIRKQLKILAKKLCQRKLSVGADGLLVIERSKKCNFKMRILNPDGNEVDMCGNGARCAALYAVKYRICPKRMSIETLAGNLEAQLIKDKVRLKLSDPKSLSLQVNLNIQGQVQEAGYINTGVPHVVCFVQRLDKLNVYEIGKAIRYHSEFQPEGANANFVEVLSKGHIRIRTYERGVEEETLACGTGAVAAGIVTVFHMQESPSGKYKVKVDTQGNEALLVYFNITKNKINQVYLEGKAKITYQGGLYV